MKNKSHLKQGNAALRKGDHKQAIKEYILALQKSPELKDLIVRNIALARMQYHRIRLNDVRPKIAGFSWDIDRIKDSFKSNLNALHGVEYDLIGGRFNQSGQMPSPCQITDKIQTRVFTIEDHGRFSELALEHVSLHPYDMVYLQEADLPNILIGIAYQIIWNTKVLIGPMDEESPYELGKYIQDQIPDLPARDLRISAWSDISIALVRSAHEISPLMISLVLSTEQDDCAFLNILYLVMFGREPKSHEIEHFGGLLQRGQMNRLDLTKTLQESQEHINYNREGNRTSIAARRVYPFPSLGDIWPREIKLPHYDDPLVSVLIPVYGKLEFTLACLKSISDHLPVVSFEVLVIDDQSPDNSLEILLRVKNARIIKNHENLGFLRSCNSGVSHAKGKYIFFLNNDTQVKHGWLDELLKTYNLFNDVGLVGSKLIYPDGSLQEAGSIVWNDATAWNYGNRSDPLLPCFNYVREVDYCSGAAILIETELFRELGGFDELYLPAYCEDTDLAFKVRKSGKSVYFQPASQVIHFEGISHGTDTNKGIKAYQITNQRKFHEKWKNVLEQEHYCNGQNVFLAKGRSRLKKKILVIDHYIPKPDFDAGSRTMFQFMQLFSKKGMDIKFWPDNSYYDRKYALQLEQLGVEILAGDEFSNAFESWISEHGKFFDVVLLSRPHVSVNYIDLIRAHTSARVLYYGHDIHHIRLESQLNLNSDSLVKSDLIKVKELELRMWSTVDVVYYPSENETKHVSEWLSKNCQKTIAKTIPVYAFDSFPTDPWSNISERSDLIFVGGFAHKPNVDGAVWFVSEVFSKILKVLPHVHLRIVGSNPSDEVCALSSENITVTGFVTDSDLFSLYQKSRLAIAPLRFGGGMKGKVVESMRFGLPCVTTNFGAQGLPNTSKFLPVADEASQFAKEVITLLKDDRKWLEVSKSCQDYARSNFSENALWEVVSTDINKSSD